MNGVQQSTARAIVNVFETGRIEGNYAGIAVMKGDSGHLSYGRSQAALGSGVLFELIDAYCRQPSAAYAAPLRPYLTRLKNKDASLDTDAALKATLKTAAVEDPVMRVTQDQFFDSRYLVPASRAAAALGIEDPLGITVIYDSHIQGGWQHLQPQLGPVAPKGPRDWVQRYLARRRAWLSSLKAPLPSTVYRMDSLDALAKLGNWNLDLPLTVHGVAVTADALARDGGDPRQPRCLQLVLPYIRGVDVTALQRELKRRQLPAVEDAVYGPFTATLVHQWQVQQGISEEGVGVLTRKSLGL